MSFRRFIAVGAVAAVYAGDNAYADGRRFTGGVLRASALLDEPLTGLDSQLHERLLRDIADILRTLKTTVIHVTHDLEEASTLSQRVVQIASLDSPPISGGSVTAPEV